MLTILSKRLIPSLGLTRATRVTGLPILVVDGSSYETATRVRDLDPGLPVDDLERIEAVTDCIADALDASWLESLPSSARSRRLSPALSVTTWLSKPVPPARAWSCPKVPTWLRMPQA